MNNYYTNTTKTWYPDEDGQLIREHKYRTYKLLQLAHIHKRTPDSVIRRLGRLGKIKSASEVHGYEEYRNSSLFYILNPVTQSKDDKTEESTKALDTIAEVDEEGSVLDCVKVDTKWTREEDVNLFKLQAQPLLKIASTLNRHPGDVACQMKKLKIAKAYQLINGFDSYKNTPLYIEYQKARRKKKTPLQDSSPDAVLRGEMGEVKTELSAIRDELEEMRASFRELRTFISQSFEDNNKIKSAVKRIYHINRNFR